MKEPATVTVHVLDTADAISPMQWQQVAATVGFYSSPRWLRVLEDDPYWDCWYLAARDAAGRLLGVLPAYLPSGAGHSGADTFYDPSRIFTGPDGLRDPDRWTTALLIGGRSGYETDLLLKPDLSPAQRAQVLTALLGRARTLANAWGASGVAAVHVPEPVATEVASVTGADLVLSELTSAIDCRGAVSLDDLSARLHRHRRFRIRKEVRDFESSTFRLRWVRLSDAVEPLARLAADHHQRYGSADTTAMLTVHLQQQAERLDDLSRVLLCERAGQTVGALLAYEWQDVWYARLGAAGQGLRGQQSALFNLFYYAPLERAMQTGADRYVTGPSSLTTKLLRGATAVPRWTVLTDLDTTRTPWRVSAEQWNQRRRAGWMAELGTAVGSEAMRDNQIR